MVLGQHEDMVGLSQTDQAAADQGPSGQIERGLDLLGTQPLKLHLCIGGTVQVVPGEGQAGSGRKQFDPRQALGGAEQTAQGLVTVQDPIQASLQSRDVELSAQAQGQRHVVGRAHAIELRQEPQALLGEGRRQRRVTGDRLDRRQRLGP